MFLSGARGIPTARHAEDAVTQPAPLPDDAAMRGPIPYLAMYGQSGAAADFYIRAFGAADGGRVPMEGAPGRFMHVQLVINGGALMMTDHGQPGAGAPGESPLPSGHLQLVVADGRAWWDRAVAAGCTVEAPFERQFWGDDWGLLRDPFGIRWGIMQDGAGA
jgi:PhnB protein